MKIDLELIKALADEMRELLAEERRTADATIAGLRSELGELRTLVSAIPSPAQTPAPVAAVTSVDPEVLRALVEKAVDAIPRPKDGRDVDPDVLKGLIWKAVSELPPPRDGRDGIATTDELKALVEAEVEKRLDAEVEKRVTTKLAAIPIPTYRGWFKDGTEYEAGNMVTYGNELWHCNNLTSERPPAAGKWTLVARKGRDAREPARTQRAS